MRSSPCSSIDLGTAKLNRQYPSLAALHVTPSFNPTPGPVNQPLPYFPGIQAEGIEIKPEQEGALGRKKPQPQYLFRLFRAGAGA
jgi:hypothetical protein